MLKVERIITLNILVNDILLKQWLNCVCKWLISIVNKLRQTGDES